MTTDTSSDAGNTGTRAERLIAPLMPAAASWALARCEAAGHVATEHELAVVERAVPKRRTEFVAGRSVARRALARFGLGGAEILTGRHREPLWPPGIVGSISHAGGVAVAAVAPESTLACLGIDLEVRAEEALATDAVICRGERAAFDRLSRELGAGAFYVYFSAKEAVFKAMYRRARRYFDFLDVVLEPGAGRTFRCRPQSEAPRDPDWGRLRVAWDCDRAFVFSVASLGVDAGAPDPG